MIHIFYSYSHKDETLRDELETHLALLKRQGIIHGWHDRRITAGTEWANAIDNNLEASQIILLLISANFLASDYCYDKEMKRALEKHATGESRVIPIIIRSVDWSGAPFSHLQVLPKDAKPVASWADHDKAWTDVAKGIRKVVEELTVNPRCLSELRWHALGEAMECAAPTQPFFTGREDVLARLYAQLTVGSAAVLAQPQVISGFGGIGKTQTAIEYCLSLSR